MTSRKGTWKSNLLLTDESLGTDTATEGLVDATKYKIIRILIMVLFNHTRCILMCTIVVLYIRWWHSSPVISIITKYRKLILVLIGIGSKKQKIYM